MAMNTSFKKNNNKKKSSGFKRNTSNGTDKKRSGFKNKGDSEKMKNAEKRNGLKSENKGKDKLVLTRENINSHLLSYTQAPEGYKLMGMLTFLFKEFKEQPSDLLAKIKILTMNKKIINEDMSEGANKCNNLPKSILNHIFAIFDMKDSFIENLFKFLRNKTYLAELSTDMYFETAMDNENFGEHFNQLSDEIIRVWESKSYASFDEFKSAFERIGAVQNLEDFKTDKIEKEIESEGDEEGSDDKMETSPEVKNMVIKANQELEEGSFSLISLDDQEEMERMDRSLGMIFASDNVSEENKTYSLSLVRCLERLVKANYIFDINLLIKLFYIDQFEVLFYQFKYLIKAFIAKFSDKARIFRMFQIAAIEIPQIYKLSSIVQPYCGDAFDVISFIKVAINNHQGASILNRIERQKFYDLYNTSLGAEYDLFFIDLLANERSANVLGELLSRENTPEVTAAIRETIATLDKRTKKDVVKRKGKKAIKDKKVKDKHADEVTVSKTPRASSPPKNSKKSDEVVSETDKKPKKDAELTINDVEEDTPSKRDTPKRPFADRIGKKVFTEREDKKKQFRMKNLKDKTRTKNIEKYKATETDPEAGVKITKKSLREKENKPPAKKIRKN